MLCELPLLRRMDDVDLLNVLASRFVQRDFKAGDAARSTWRDTSRMQMLRWWPPQYGTRGSNVGP